jgi:intracellular septation protein
MRFLFDLLPVILFFVAYQFGGIYGATGVAMAASVLQIAWLLATRRKVEVAAWISLAVITLFGGLTLWTHEHNVLGIEPTVFIRWKPTALYWIFAAILFLAPVVLGHNPIRALLGKELHLPDSLWGRLNLAWALFFTLLGLLNLYVAFNFAEPVWVKFKVFGLLALMVIFIVGQGFVLSRHLENKDDR